MPRIRIPATYTRRTILLSNKLWAILDKRVDEVRNERGVPYNLNWLISDLAHDIEAEENSKADEEIPRVVIAPRPARKHKRNSTAAA
jgi:hypothetical protein